MDSKESQPTKTFYAVSCHENVTKIQSAGTEPNVTKKRDQESYDALTWPGTVLGNQMQLSVLQIFELSNDKTIT